MIDFENHECRLLEKLAVDFYTKLAVDFYTKLAVDFPRIKLALCM